MRDIDIRRVLRRDVDNLHARAPDTVVIEELGLCQGRARIDIAVINGSVHGFEIKSEYDTLARLPNQSQSYNRVFNYITVVTAETHAKKIAEVVPQWWGISMALSKGDSVEIVTKRVPSSNCHIDPFALAQLLWRDEVLEELSALGLDVGMKSKPRKELWRHLATNVPLGQLGELVRRRIKQRPLNWRLHEPLR
jgi:hypothetical protein